MQNFVYPANLKPEARGRFTVTFRDLPEAITSGKSQADALLQAADCLDEAIAGRIADGLEIPRPSRRRHGEVSIPLPAPMAAKAALCLALRETKLSQNGLARKLKLDGREIRRMLDPRHATKLARIQRVLTVLGKRLSLVLEDAA
ncbi:MAG TPA: type II toxin-antitoxin system HicB family antitoxin [Bryobacteraceae bacterium]|nr:type II toxin-antitoxin system HicB family antitoxin [Bryobacteraceae bacterium]